MTETKALVLVVEDEEAMCAGLVHNLEYEGYRTLTAVTGREALERLQKTPPDLVLLDIMLPEMNGFDVLRELRLSHPKLPVIVLTSKGLETDKLQGFKLGADDYVTKPCTPRELTARVRAILRRTHDTKPDGAAAAAHAVGKLTVLPEQRRATWDGALLELTSTEFNLLEVLARHAGRPVSKGELSEQGLGRPLARFDRNIDVHLSSLRHKLGMLEDGRSPLQTVYRLGYQLIRD